MITFVSSVLLVVASFGQPQKTDFLKGTWPIVANVSPGKITLTVRPDNTLVGTIFGEAIEGKVNPDGTGLTFKRFSSNARGADRRVVQVYSGTVSHDDEFRPGVSFIGGQFYESDAKGEPTSDGRYTWVMSLGRDSEPKNLTELQGHWRLESSFLGHPADAELLGKTTGLDQKGTVVEVRGKELLRDGKLVATLNNAIPEVFGHLPVYHRRLLDIKLVTGEAFRCAYRKIYGHWELVYPYSVVRIGGSQFSLRPLPAK